jgi:diguanylate cyclase (GGDEF)-like protein/PAS domain S-box-containing protein
MPATQLKRGALPAWRAGHGRMTIDLIKGVALLLALSQLQAFNVRLWRHNKAAEQLGGGILFGAICIVGMMMPIAFTPGVIFDARSVILGMAGLFGGPLVGLIAAAIAAAYRTWLGGVGVGVGVAVIFASMLLGLAYRHGCERGWFKVDGLRLLGFGFLLHAMVLFLFTFLPPEIAQAVIARLTLPILVTFPPATAILGLLLQDVAHRFETENSLSRSEARLRATINAIPDVMIVLDEDGRYVEVLSAESNLLYAPSPQLIGQLMSDVLPRKLADQFTTVIHRTLQTQQGQQLEYELDTLDGLHQFECRTQPLGHTVNNRRTVLFLAHDITERKQAADRLLAEKNLSQRYLETVEAIIVSLDTRGIITVINRKGCELLGYQAHELIGKNWFSLCIPIKDAAVVYPVAQRILAGDIAPVEYFENTIITRRGESRLIAWHNNALRDENGIITGTLSAGEDITERRAAEDALRESEARFRNLLQNNPSISVQGYAADGTTLYWNHASEKLYGYTAGEAIGRNIMELIIPPAMRSPVAREIAQMFETRQAIPAAELTLMRKDGSEVTVFSSHAHLQPPGQAPEMFCFDIDLSERKRAEAELRVAATAFETQEGMLVTDAERVILRVNKAWSEITGYSPRDVIGRKPDLFKSEHHDAAFFAMMNAQLEAQGEWKGEIWNRRMNGEVFPAQLSITAVRDNRGLVSHYVATLTDITQRKATENQIRQLAFYDSLTGLPNRRLLTSRLQHALVASARTASNGALLFIDLDHFKTLNDTLGHDTGDLLLQAVAQRLPGAVREGDTVARLGGDEYVVVLENLSVVEQDAAAQAKAVCEKVLDILHQPYQLAGREHYNSASIGVTLFSGHKDTIDDLLKQADLAMYQAKSAGRKSMRFFDPDMQAVVNARAALEADVRQGIKLGQYLLHYQPQVDAHGHITGAEVLLRWSHPLRGMVPPAEFIPLAEETGHILALGHWVLETACNQLAQWAMDPDLQDLTLAVNISARQFRQIDFAEQVFATLERTGAQPHRLKLELTESMLVDNLEDTVAKMMAIRQLGVGFSLDDFGTGYSSLSYLKRLPLDQLKIDQSFVQDLLTDPNDAAIAQTIIALGHNLGLTVIAEGVETEAQQAVLANHGCDAYQGYLFSRPLSLADFRQWVTAAPYARSRRA